MKMMEMSQCSSIVTITIQLSRMQITASGPGLTSTLYTDCIIRDVIKRNYPAIKDLKFLFTSG